MESPKILKNPKQESVEFRYGGKLYIFPPGVNTPVDAAAANHFLTLVHTGLMDVTEQVMNPVEPETGLNKLGLPQLLKLAKEKGIKTKFGMKKTEVLALLVNG